MSDVALGLNFPASGDCDPQRDRAAVEPAYPQMAVEAFFQFMMLQDLRYEVTPCTRLPGTEGDRRRLEFVKQSEESDDEGQTPTPYCSGCGSCTCKTGADRCVRQRKCERLELVTEFIFDTLNDQASAPDAVLVDPNQRRGKQGSRARGPTRPRGRGCIVFADPL